MSQHRYTLWFALGSVFLLSPLFSATAQAFDISATANKWPGAQTVIYTGVPGTSRSGIPWSVALQRAAGEWTDETRFNFVSNPLYRDPCIGTTAGTRPDNLNGIDFRANVCGNDFGASTLAVTVFFTEFNMLGAADIVEADIVFNQNLNFDVYDGLQRPGSNTTREYDFQRVALHELGHVLGLGHDNRLPAIMNSSIGDLSRLQSDDIAGVDQLYAGINNCENRPLRFGWNYGQLTSGDCRIQQLISGGTDQSFVDVYTLQVPEQTTLSFDAITDGILDSVLLLTDPNLGILVADEGSAGNCNPGLSRTLEPGDYVLLVNTYSDINDAGCGRTNTGSYRLSVTYQRDELLELSGRQSFLGGQVEARFLGAVTADGGQSYSNRVSAQQPFDVVARIEPDQSHVGQNGFIVIAGLLDTGEILVKNTAGDFVEYQPDQVLIPIAERRLLGEVENIDVLARMVASEIGIESIEVDFLVGYGVDSNPQELYFHEQPINLIVE